MNVSPPLLSLRSLDLQHPDPSQKKERKVDENKLTGLEPGCLQSGGEVAAVRDPLTGHSNSLLWICKKQQISIGRLSLLNEEHFTNVS